MAGRVLLFLPQCPVQPAPPEKMVLQVNRVRRVCWLHFLLLCLHWAPLPLPAVLDEFNWLDCKAWPAWCGPAPEASVRDTNSGALHSRSRPQVRRMVKWLATLK